MSLTRISIEKTRITGTLIALITVAGYMAYQAMPRSQDPGFTVRTAMITTFFHGASPERIEKLVTDPLEKAIQEMPELEYVLSTSKTGASIIYVELKERYFDVRPIWDSLRRKVERERPALPQGVIGPFVNDEFGDVFGVVVGIIGDGYSYAELKQVADQARDALLMLDNVAKVEIIGAQEERVFLEFNNARLAKLGITPYQLQQILTTQNIVIPGGSLHVEDERIFLEPTGNFESLAEIESTVIALPGRPEVITLSDLVSVTRDYNDPPTRRMYTNGFTSLGLAMSMRSGGNIINMGDEVTATLAKLKSQYPIGIEFEVVAFEPEAVAATIGSFTSNLGQAVVIVSLSMLLFLGLRTGLVVATLIPTTILATFLIMHQLGIGLDKISLAALIIALGMLVDNAIVMSESIMVMMAEGKSGVQAAIDSAKELNVSLLTSSLTTAAAFLPIFLAESSTGEYTSSLFTVVTIALLASWLLSLTIIPLLCARFLKPEPAPEGAAYQTPFYRMYRHLLLIALKRPMLTVLVVILTFVVSLQGFKYIPAAFFPESDQPMFTAEVVLPTGTAIEVTDEVVRQIDAFVARELKAGEGKEGILNWSSYVGEGAPRFYLSYAPVPPSPEYGFFLFNVTDYRLSRELIGKLKTWVEATFPDAVLNGQLLPNGPPVTDPVAVRVSGRDSEVLFQLTEKIKAKLKEIPGTVDVEDDWGLLNKKMVIHVNQARARRAGLSSQDIAISLQTLLSGVEITQYREDDKTIPIILRSTATDREDLGNLEQLSVYSQITGGSVPLRQIADVEVVWEAPLILRRDRLRTVTVASKLTAGASPTSVESELIPWLQKESATWPAGYRYQMGGENEESVKSQKSISDKLPVAAMIVILLLVGQFNSVRRAVIILATLPLAVIGVVIGMLITQVPLGFMAFLGIISLFGIVVNNAIVLIDRIDFEIRELGHSPQQAVMEAGQRRLRPIFLTTLTTLAGLIPLWTGGGPMFEPMAVALIFGLGFSTVLTLGVIPVLYGIFFKVSFKDYQET